MYEMLAYWKIALLVAVLAVTGAGFAGCHTVEGAGRDVQTIGEGVEGAADETRPYD